MYSFTKYAAAVIAAGLLIGCGPEEAPAFSLRLPVEFAAPDPADRLQGVPFKHRTYGDMEAVVMRVVDGDTLYARIVEVHPIIGYEIGIRVYGIDTRELDDGGDKSGDMAKALLLPGTRITLKNLRRGKFFRIVAEVWFDMKSADGTVTTRTSLAQLLLDKDLAYPYYGGTKRPKGWQPKQYEHPDEGDGE